MFMGQYEHAIDDKKRLFIPTKMRAHLGKTRDLILTCGFEECLFLYPVTEWKRITAKLRDTSVAQGNPKDYRAFVRMFLSAAEQVSVDMQGRILIPQMHAEYASLDTDVVIIGMIERIELWSKQRWTPYRDKAREAFDSAAQKIFDL